MHVAQLSYPLACAPQLCIDSVRFPVFMIGEIAQHDLVGGALKLAFEGFLAPRGGVLAHALA